MVSLLQCLFKSRDKMLWNCERSLADRWHRGHIPSARSTGHNGQQQLGRSLCLHFVVTLEKGLHFVL